MSLDVGGHALSNERTMTDEFGVGRLACRRSPTRRHGYVCQYDARVIPTTRQACPGAGLSHVFNLAELS
jgi:hypothetical protein